MFREESKGKGLLNIILKLLQGVAVFLIDGIKNTHKEGHIFILLGVIATIIGYWTISFLGTICFILTGWIIYFFRDPHRVVPQKEGILVAPADGVITAIVKGEELPEELHFNTETTFTRISIFLNVFNVHVNRIPVKAEVEKTCYVPGKFLNANLDKSSKENERNILLLKTEGGEYIGLTQIAGLIARRIVSYAKQTDNYETGERYGIIRFGSRVDVFIPEHYKVCVEKGQTMIGGETIIASK